MKTLQKIFPHLAIKFFMLGAFISAILLGNSLLAIKSANETNIVLFFSGISILVINIFVWLLYRQINQMFGAKPDYLLKKILYIANGHLQSTSENNNNQSDLSLLSAINLMANQINQIVFQIKQNTSEIISYVQQMSAQYNEISFASQMQGISTNQTTESITEIQSRINTISEIVIETESYSNEVVRLSVNGANLLADTLTGMAEIKSMLHETALRITKLQQGSENINAVINLIKGIADQTNLLALNAAIEAARAGAHGRGFAVVADEVRKLAEHTAKAAVDVSSMVKEVQAETLQVVNAMNMVQPMIDTGVTKSGTAVNSLRNIENRAATTLEKINSISTAVQDEVSRAADIVDNLAQISEMLKMTDSAVESAALTTVKLEHTVAELETAVNQFKNDSI